MTNKNFYLTTTLPYVNADPHIGFALEIIQADVIARYHKLLGKNVIFNTGTDEHGLKIYRKAFELGIEPQKYCDEYAAKFDALKQALNLSYTHFIRTTDPHHIKAAQEFWLRCEKNGDIYKKNYSVKYCVGCELEKTDSELAENKCPVHPNLEIELIEEENYFFKFSKFQKPLLELYAKNPNFVIPANRLLEIKNFVEKGLEDFSISRLKEKMPWGIPVPNDEKHVMYVWFDALINYISTLGWPEEDEENFNNFWPGVQVAGKDNLRQQSAMWQAMLMAADVPNTYQIAVNGHITGEGGVKMSKSLGNIIDPKKVSAEYGADALRYFLLREVSSFEDSPFSEQRFKETYNANLANGLGNLVSRVMKMAEDNLGGPVEISEWEDMQEFFDYLNKFEINKACDFIWSKIGEMDKFIQESQPFKVIKTDKEKGMEMIRELVVKLYSVARLLNPILPETSNKIKELIKQNKTPQKPLFARKD
ncbi:MAG: Methionine-tRNA ligase [Candidatus Magasanikbacteria bacterium GW2011_GWA2_37_8]|uniref:Methionine--tRNA ligase n=1 Tax=Candidatus Magasanikbacteria bacterium GW2011_GWA2_37_8 TaxID=1619036 RepID=A0A0G0H906_9BACT|nr:MAG: Methionine-tRNA ligase [Candidatus Magasanikbacteria bacterium GW2011_GWA2_37_8]